MSSKRTGVAPGASGAASKKAAQPRGAAALHPPPASATAAVASGAASQPKRFDWIESTVGGSTLPAGLRPASRADSRAGSRPRSPAPDFWSRQSAAQVVDASVKDPALKLTLLTRALEESRARIAHLQQDRTAVADAVLELCLAAGAGPAGCSAGGGEAVAAGDDADAPTAAAAEEDVLPLRLDQLGTRLAQLRQALAEQEVAAAEARAAHERAALQVVAGQQQREALDAQLEEVGGWVGERMPCGGDEGLLFGWAGRWSACPVSGLRRGCLPSFLHHIPMQTSALLCHPAPGTRQARYAAQQHDAARHAAQTKAALLEEQLGAAAESARRRMEEQLDTFRGDAATARWVGRSERGTGRVAWGWQAAPDAAAGDRVKPLGRGFHMRYSSNAPAQDAARAFYGAGATAGGGAAHAARRRRRAHVPRGRSRAPAGAAG